MCDGVVHDRERDTLALNPNPNFGRAIRFELPIQENPDMTPEPISGGRLPSLSRGDLLTYSAPQPSVWEYH